MRDTIKVGVIADQTGALSPLGGAQANTATLVVDEINASGGVLGGAVGARRIEGQNHQRNQRRVFAHFQIGQMLIGGIGDRTEEDALVEPEQVGGGRGHQASPR